MNGRTVPPGIHPATGGFVLPSLANACAELAASGSPVLEQMAASVARADGMPTIVVRFASVYGLVKCYPACPSSAIFARIAGNKTLRPSDLEAIRALGYAVRLTDGSRELLERFVAGA